MNESNKKPELDDLDWDAALNEWEHDTFVPEVATDKDTNQPAGIVGAAPARPLYRPPPPLPGSRGRGAAPSADAPKAEGASRGATSQAPQAGPEREERGKPGEPPSLPNLADFDDDEGNATVIAAIPRELLRGAGRRDDAPRSARGGLGQLFAKADRREDSVDVHFDDVASSAERAARPVLELASESLEAEDPSVVTSAKDVPFYRPRASAEPLKRPSLASLERAVPDGEMFDPFQEDPLASPGSASPRPPRVGKAPPLAPTPPRGTERAKDLGERTTTADFSDLAADIAAREAAREAGPHLPPTPAPPPAPTPDASLALLDEIEENAREALALERNAGLAPARAARASARDADDGEDDEITGTHGVELIEEGEHEPGPPVLLAPETREYDPQAETSVFRGPLAPAPSEMANAAAVRDGRDGREASEPAVIDLVGVGDDEDEPTQTRESGPRLPIAPGTSAAPPVLRASVPSPAELAARASRNWEDERRASARLGAEQKQDLRERAAWIEEEARARDEAPLRARLLLAASELRALAGDRDKALSLTKEAFEGAETLSLAGAQLRGLLGVATESDDAEAEGRGDDEPAEADDRAASAVSAPGRDDAAVIALLEREAASAPTASARAHAALCAAEMLDRNGDREGAKRLLATALAATPQDVRAPIALAALALSAGETDSPALLPNLLALREAAQVLAALRGAGDVSVPAAFSAVDAARRVRRALDAQDAADAATALTALAGTPRFSDAARWLAAAVAATATETAMLARDAIAPLVGRAVPLAVRFLLGQLLRSNGSALPAVADALATANDALRDEERAVVTALAGGSVPPGVLEAMFARDETRALAVALAGLTSDRDDVASAHAPLFRIAEGSVADGVLPLVLGRLFASRASGPEVDAVLGAYAAHAPEKAWGLLLEQAAKTNATVRLAELLAEGARRAPEGAAPDEDEGASGSVRALAAAWVCEQAGETTAAHAFYAAALRDDPGSLAAMRALVQAPAAAREGDAPFDAAYALEAAAKEARAGFRDPVEADEAFAALHVEAALRVEDPARRRALLETAHRAAPHLGIAAHLAEETASQAEDRPGVVAWIRTRREESRDPVEAALEGVREALAELDVDVGLGSDAARERILEAKQAVPDDVVAFDLAESIAPSPPEELAATLERFAALDRGESKAALALEAAYAFERAGDMQGAARASRTAASAAPSDASSNDSALAAVVRERADWKTGDVAAVADDLLALAKGASDPRMRREAYERLARLDRDARGDAASALLWHRALLEDHPAALPSLRYLEHAFVTDGRLDELGPIAASVARALTSSAERSSAPASSGADEPSPTAAGGPEAAAHAELAVRLSLRGPEGDWEGTREMVELASRLPEPPLNALRRAQAHARARGDDRAYLATTKALLERAQRPLDVAVLALRAGETAARASTLEEARALLERAAAEDPGDVVTWGMLADVRQRADDPRGAAEACECLARTSVVAEHRLLAWYDAGRIWLDEVRDAARGIMALEQAASIDVTFQDTFTRLAELYAARGAASELATLLDRRLETVVDPDERAAMLLERARVLLEIADREGARQAFRAALEARPENTEALAEYGSFCAAEGDWAAAEAAWVALARLLTAPEDQRIVYARLGDLYAHHAVNLSRAELSFREVLRRAPGDEATLAALVDVYRRQNDPARAVETQQELVNGAKSPDDKRKRVLELAALHETLGRDARRAEQTFEAARREFPGDATVLRATAEFFARQRKLPAVHVLLDRAANDARRAFAGGRVAPPLFETMATVHALRGREDAARVADAARKALLGEATGMRGAEARALDPRLDELLAPEIVSPALRALLARTGNALEAAIPLDPRALSASPLPQGALAAAIAAVGQVAGIGPLAGASSARLGSSVLAVGGAQPLLILGDGLLSATPESARAFLILRATKLVQARAATLARTSGPELSALVAALLRAFNSNFAPNGVNASAVREFERRIASALPKNLEPDVGLMAFEVIGASGHALGDLGSAVLAWANRVALLGVGDPWAALEALAWASGLRDGAPKERDARLAWASQNAEARDLLAFSVSDAYAEARVKVGLARPSPP
jgi:Tfp pilus assembly protein PilF